MGLELDIKARSESEIENYIDEIDALMVGPHLAYILDEVEEYTHGNEVKVILMKAEYYSTLDGRKGCQSFDGSDGLKPNLWGRGLLEEGELNDAKTY